MNTLISIQLMAKKIKFIIIVTYDILIIVEKEIKHLIRDDKKIAIQLCGHFTNCLYTCILKNIS